MAKKLEIKDIEFTENELKTMQLYITGLTSVQIAEKMSAKKRQINRRTIEHYIWEARAKVKAKSSLHLAVMMVEAGIISLKKK